MTAGAGTSATETSQAGVAGWALVPAVLVRSTGFAFEEVEALRSAAIGAAGDRLLVADVRVAAAQDEFVNDQFDKVLAQEQAAEAGRSVFKAWYSARRQVRRGQLVPADHLAAGRAATIDTWLAGWNDLVAARAAAWHGFTTAVAAAVAQGRAALRRAGAADRFGEAVFLSSPGMYAGLRRFLDQPQRSSAELERRVYGYLQRFATKNDTTSYFGPVDHGVVATDPAAPRLVLNPTGRPWQRRSRPAYWLVAALAQGLAADPALLPHLAVRLATGLRLAVAGPGAALCPPPPGQPIPLTATEAQLLARVDGARTVADLAAPPGPAGHAALHQLAARRLVRLEVPLPTSSTDPLARLRRWLAALPPDLPARAGWLAVLAELAGLAAEFPAAPVPRKAALLQRAEALPGGPGAPTRAGGGLFTDRLAIYDDALGDLTCRIGPAQQADLAARLRPALDLCAGYSGLVQRASRQRAAALLAELGGGPVPFLAFARELQQRVGLAGCLADPAVVAFQDRLAGLVTARAASGEPVTLTAADLAPLLVPVPAGTLVSPDLLLAAPTAAAVAAGDYQLVVGEIHHGAQVWTHLLTFWPDRPALAAAIERLLPPASGQRVALVHDRRQGKAFPLELPGRSVEIGGRSARPREQVLPIAEVTVAGGPAGWPMLHSDRWGWLEPYPGDPRSIVNWVFGTPPVVRPPLHTGLRTPRVSAGGAVLWRACWRPPPGSLLAGRPGSPLADGWATLLAQWHQHGLPERCFVRVAAERKPFYLDIQSAPAVTYLRSMLAGAGGLELTEVLPAPADWWLPAPGGAGRRSCEWRTTWVYGGRHG